MARRPSITPEELRDTIDGRSLIDDVLRIRARMSELIKKCDQARNTRAYPYREQQVRSKALTELQFLKEQRDILMKLLNKKLPDLKQTELKVTEAETVEDAFRKAMDKTVGNGASSSDGRNKATH